MRADASIWQHIDHFDQTASLNFIGPVLDRIVDEVNNYDLLMGFFEHLRGILERTEAESKVFWQVWRTRRWQEKQVRRNYAIIRFAAVAYISGLYRGRQQAARRINSMLQRYDLVSDRVPSTQSSDRVLDTRAMLEAMDRLRDLLLQIEDHPQHMSVSTDENEYQ